MDRNDLLAERFEEHWGHLRAVAYRMLGSRSEAEDAVRKRGSGSTGTAPAGWRTSAGG